MLKLSKHNTKGLQAKTMLLYRQKDLPLSRTPQWHFLAMYLRAQKRLSQLEVNFAPQKEIKSTKPKWHQPILLSIHPWMLFLIITLFVSYMKLSILSPPFTRPTHTLELHVYFWYIGCMPSMHQRYSEYTVYFRCISRSRFKGTCKIGVYHEWCLQWSGRTEQLHNTPKLRFISICFVWH